MIARDWPERVSTWRGLSIGDTIAIACWPDHAQVIDAIDYHWPKLTVVPPTVRDRWSKPTVEWATLWCRDVRDLRTRGRTVLHIDAGGRPVYRRHHNHLGPTGMWTGFHVTEHAVLILAPPPGRFYAQMPLIVVTSG